MMEIIKYGNSNSSFLFRCERCGCEYVARLDELNTGFLAKCPECGHMNESEIRASEEGGEAL
jgi:transcription elongation factor Elf1